MEALLTTVGKREACAKVRTHSVDEWMHAHYAVRPLM